MTGKTAPRDCRGNEEMPVSLGFQELRGLQDSRLVFSFAKVLPPPEELGGHQSPAKEARE